MNIVVVQCQLQVACSPYGVTFSNAVEVAEMYVSCVRLKQAPYRTFPFCE